MQTLIITPTSNKPVISQGKKERYSKRVRWLARVGLLLIPLLVLLGYRFYQYKASLLPTDFKILVTNFANSDGEDHRVTQEIFRNLEREMEQYGDDVTVERIDQSLTSIKQAKTAGKNRKRRSQIENHLRIKINKLSYGAHLSISLLMPQVAKVPKNKILIA